MKVISGIYKGRNLEGFDIIGTRPTMDRVKESLFATIQDYIRDSVVLDLFAGSGNLGIEALSNGASYVYFVDNNKKAINTIKINLSNLNIDKALVIKSDFREVLRKKEKFDIIFLDPPYKSDYIEESINLIEENDLVNKNGIVVCESSDIDKINSNKYKIIKEKKYGDKWVVILKNI